MYKIKRSIRKIHRYLGLTIGIQFIMWTVSGLYFSWTDLDQIHGDQYFKSKQPERTFKGLLSPDQLSLAIHQLELVAVGNKPFYWINDAVLVNAKTGEIRPEISKDEALEVAQQFLKADLLVKNITKINHTDAHHEYRGRPLPAYVISYNHPEALRAYVAATSGQFQRLRHRSWRWFDFLWMTHTMDYQGRDDFNNLLLRIFSLFGLFTVSSGFVLWAVSSSTLRKLRQHF